MFNPDQISDEFKARVEARHSRIQYGEPGFHSSEVEAMAPHEYGYLLHHASGIQRNVPENRMHELQRVAGGGLYSHSAEHIGDLTHRLNESGGRFGTEFVEPKVRTQLGALTHGYGYEREHMEQMHSNARYRGVPVEEHLERVHAAGQAYTEAHHTVPIYNEPSRRASWAATNLGKMDFRSTTQHLQGLHRAIQNSDQFKHLMSQQGSVEYLRQRETDLGR